MARTLTAAAKTESQKSSGVKPIALVKLAFDSGDMLVWSGRGDLAWTGDTYTGIGDLGRISAVEEGVEQKASGISFELSGIPAATISVALGEDVQGRTARIWLGFLDPAYRLIAAPVLVFGGRLDTMDVKLGETGGVSVTAESRLIDWERPRERLYTDAGQKERFANDEGFAFVNEAVEKEIVWGARL